MSWIEVRARLPLADNNETVDTSPLVEVFRDFGIENTQEEGEFLIGCVVEVEGTAQLVSSLVDSLKLHGAIEVLASPFEEQNWNEVWRQFFKPRRVGKRFVVRPTWEEFLSEPDDLVIVLDPGEAFGTGDHPTTRMCLELLESAEVDGKRVADVGCGSGILSIGAVLLGAAVVDAVDIDPSSVQVSKDNAALNDVSFLVTVGEGIRSLTAKTAVIPPIDAQPQWEQDEVPLSPLIAAPNLAQIESTCTYDIVVSNIISAILIRISPDVARALESGGKWIVSGIIQTNWPDVLVAAEKCGFALQLHLEEGDWNAALFVKK